MGILYKGWFAFSQPLRLGCSLWICSCSSRNCSRQATVMLRIDTLIANILVFSEFTFSVVARWGMLVPSCWCWSGWYVIWCVIYVAPTLWHQVVCCWCSLEERTQWQREQERLYSDIAELRSRLSQDRFFIILYIYTVSQKSSHL